MSKVLFHPSFEDINLTGIFYALGDPARLKIAQNLYHAPQPLICIEAVKGINNLPVSTRSHSFRILRESGLIHSQKQGRECYNSLRKEEIEKKFPGLLNVAFGSVKLR